MCKGSKDSGTLEGCKDSEACQARNPSERGHDPILAYSSRPGSLLCFIECGLKVHQTPPTNTRHHNHTTHTAMLSRLAQQRAGGPAALLRRKILSAARPLPRVLPRHQTQQLEQIPQIQKRTLVSAPKPGDGPLMERRPDRELPSPPALLPHHPATFSLLTSNTLPRPRRDHVPLVPHAPHLRRRHRHRLGCHLQLPEALEPRGRRYPLRAAHVGQGPRPPG